LSPTTATRSPTCGRSGLKPAFRCWRAGAGLGEQAGFAVQVKTHRDRMTPICFRCNYWIASRPSAYRRCLSLPRVRDDSRNESGPETMNTSKNPTSSLNSSESVATLATHLPNIIVGDADTHPCKRTRSVLPMSPLRRFCSPIPGVGVKLSNISLPGRLFSPR